MWLAVGAVFYDVVVLVALWAWTRSRELSRRDGRTFHVEPRRAWTVCTAIGTAVLTLALLDQTDGPLDVALIAALPLLVTLAVVDLASHRLPDVLTGSLTLVVGSVLGARPWFTSAGCAEDGIGRVLLGAAALGGLYLVLALAGGGSGMGWGDVKLAPALGGLTGCDGWTCWMVAAALPFLLAAVWGVILLLAGKGRGARMPFGPFMIAGSLVTLLGVRT